MQYDPFSRGPHPVGVRTVELRDPARDRALPTEVWYPAAASAAGADVAAATRDKYRVAAGALTMWQLAVRDAPPAPGAFPAVVFSHGFGGHRRQSTFLCTHLASHGYVVASPDHTGNTASDIFGRAANAEQVARTVADRPRDAAFVLDALAGGELSPAATDLRDTGRAAVAGHSFGGFTALAATAADGRIAATIALAPAGGESPSRTEALQAVLDLGRPRAQPHLVITADRDSVLPLAGVRDLYDRIQAPRRFVVLRDADHFHFCDAARQVHEMFRMIGVQIPLAAPLVPATQLCPPEHAYDVVRALGLAHLDAALRDSAPARAFLDQDLAAVFSARGIPLAETA